MLLFCLSALVAAIQAQSQLLPGSCNFEADTCGYTSDPDFTSWALNKDGHFVTLDVDGSDHRGNEVAPDTTSPQRGTQGVLLSPLLDQEDWSCLRLVYQITGSGTLQVQQRREGKSFDRPLWSSRTPSDSWTIASIDLQNNTENYRVVIEGGPGAGAGSSVAVFEVHISPGYCVECDFEGSQLCGYSNQWNANVNWYVGGGLARAPVSSLPDDHTRHNGTGHYMYVDSVYAKTFKEVAKMASPMTMVPMSGCLSFHYQRGEVRGNLFTVFTRDQAGQYQELWRAGSENQGDLLTVAAGEWVPVQVDVKAPYPLQVVFEVAFNSPRGGHVAVDDISFSPEFCSSETEPTFDPSVANCDFESGFCLYTQDAVSGSPWKRVSVRPNIYRRGDHTTGAGSFLLANSRLSPHSGYSSRLTGPVLPGRMKYCLRFHFSLRGFNQTAQALSVYLEYQTSGKPQEKIWTQGEKSRGFWMGTDITFQTTQPAKMVFVSTCKSFWDCGSVALDDIKVGLGDCDLTPGLLLSVPGHCDFEAGHCGYTQDKKGNTDDWVWRRGSTPTSYTGPRGDHTTGLGYYMHIEASLMLSGQNARLLSSSLRGSRGPQCLRFYYHMYGSGIGQLSVHLNKGGGDVLLWKQGGEQSITWLKATIEYQCDLQHQIVFEATRGTSVRSDIAIDDVRFESGPCPETEMRATHAPAASNEIE